MLLFLVKAFFWVIWNLTGVGFAEGRTLPLGMGRSRQEGRLLLEIMRQQGKGDPGRPADRIKAGTGAAADLRAGPLRKL
jgi:hypothetical protein